MSFAQRLKEAMHERSFTMYRLSKELGVHQTTISNWLSGRTEPRLEQLVKISEILKLSTSYLLTGETHFPEDFAADDVLRQIASSDQRSAATLTPEKYEKALISFRNVTEQAQSNLENLTGSANAVGCAMAQAAAHTLQDLKETASQASTTLAQISLALDKLNDDGQQEAAKRVEELSEIPKYQRKPNAPTEPPEGEEG